MRCASSRCLGLYALALGPTALLGALAPRIQLRGPASVAAAFVVSVIATVVSLARSCPSAESSPRSQTTVHVVAACSSAGMSIALLRFVGPYSWSELFSGLVGSFGVLALGIWMGRSIGSRVAHPAHLLAVAFASGAVDIWSTLSPAGPTHAIAERGSTALLRVLTLSAPIAPDRAPESMLGIGDVIFAALYVAAAERHALSRIRTLSAVAAGLLLAGGVAVAMRRPVPALPFVGAAVVALQSGTWRVLRRDVLPTAVAGAAFVAAVAVALRRIQ